MSYQLKFSEPSNEQSPRLTCEGRAIPRAVLEAWCAELAASYSDLVRDGGKRTMEFASAPTGLPRTYKVTAQPLRPGQRVADLVLTPAFGKTGQLADSDEPSPSSETESVDWRPLFLADLRAYTGALRPSPEARALFNGCVNRLDELAAQPGDVLLPLLLAGFCEVARSAAEQRGCESENGFYTGASALLNEICRDILEKREVFATRIPPDDFGTTVPNRLGGIGRLLAAAFPFVTTRPGGVLAAVSPEVNAPICFG